MSWEKEFFEEYGGEIILISLLNDVLVAMDYHKNSIYYFDALFKSIEKIIEDIEKQLLCDIRLSLVDQKLLIRNPLEKMDLNWPDDKEENDSK